MAMELSRIRQVLLFYDYAVRAAVTCAVEHQDRLLRIESGSQTEQHIHHEHCLSVIERLVKMIDEEPNRREKIMRWYGFLQGALWSAGLFTVNDLKAHSNPEMPPPQIPQARC